MRLALVVASLEIVASDSHMCQMTDWLSHPMSWASLAPASTPPCSLWSAPAEWRLLTLHDAWAVMSHVNWNGRSMFTSSGLLLASLCLAACVGCVGVASGSSVVWQLTSVFSLVALPCPALPRSHFLFNLPVNASRWIHFMYSQFTIYNYYLPENKSPLFAGVFTVQMFGINTFCTLKYAQQMQLFSVNMF